MNMKDYIQFPVQVNLYNDSIFHNSFFSMYFSLLVSWQLVASINRSLSLPTKSLSTSMLFPHTSSSSRPHIFCHFPLPFSMDKTYLPQNSKSCIKEHLYIIVVLVFFVRVQVKWHKCHVYATQNNTHSLYHVYKYLKDTWWCEVNLIIFISVGGKKGYKMA